MKIFEYMMRNAAPILFWASVLIFLGGLATTLLLERGLNPYSSSEGLIDASTLVAAIYQALATAALPFMGAAIIWTIQRGRKDSGE